MKHPLINIKSTHYQMFDERDTIECLEQLMTVEELKGWAKGNVYKYRMRIGHKDAQYLELEKIKGYEEYFKYLDNRQNNKGE